MKSPTLNLGFLFLILFFLGVGIVTCTHSEHGVVRYHDENALMPPKCANGRTMTYKQYEANKESWVTCRWQRIEVIDWVKLGFDLDGDEQLSLDEIITARNFYFNKLERRLGEAATTVMTNCDCDGDGYITRQDFIDADFSCLADCRKAGYIYYFIGSRIVNGTAFGAKQDPDESYKPEDMSK